MPSRSRQALHSLREASALADVASSLRTWRDYAARQRLAHSTAARRRSRLHDSGGFVRELDWRLDDAIDGWVGGSSASVDIPPRTRRGLPSSESSEAMLHELYASLERRQRAPPTSAPPTRLPRSPQPAPAQLQTPSRAGMLPPNWDAVASMLSSPGKTASELRTPRSPERSPALFPARAWPPPSTRASLDASRSVAYASAALSARHAPSPAPRDLPPQPPRTAPGVSSPHRTQALGATYSAHQHGGLGASNGPSNGPRLGAVDRALLVATLGAWRAFASEHATAADELERAVRIE